MYSESDIAGVEYNIRKIHMPALCGKADGYRIITNGC
jgi:hypothetical protein